MSTSLDPSGAGRHRNQPRDLTSEIPAAAGEHARPFVVHVNTGDDSTTVAVHKTANRALATLALLLAIVLMVALVVGYFRVSSALDQFGDALGGVGTAVEEPFVPEPFESVPGDEFDGGGGGYTGTLNDDGSLCVGYGCTPEMDAQLDAGEAEANE